MIETWVHRLNIDIRIPVHDFLEHVFYQLAIWFDLSLAGSSMIQVLITNSRPAFGWREEFEDMLQARCIRICRQRFTKCVASSWHAITAHFWVGFSWSINRSRTCGSVKFSRMELICKVKPLFAQSACCCTLSFRSCVLTSRCSSLNGRSAKYTLKSEVHRVWIWKTNHHLVVVGRWVPLKHKAQKTQT